MSRQRTIVFCTLLATLSVAACLSIAGADKYEISAAPTDNGGSDTFTTGTGGGSTGTGGGSCSAPTGKACDLITECGCGASQNCVSATTLGATKCVTAGLKANGSKCSADEECQRGSMCRRGLCDAFCADSSLCGSGEVCEPMVHTDANGDVQNTPNTSVCKRRCDDPTSTTVCPAGQTCFLYQNANNAWLGQCAGAGTARTTGGCAIDPYACAPGYNCYLENCRRYCHIGGTDCPTGQSCRPHTTPASVGGTMYGMCTYDCSPLGSPSGCATGEKCVPLVFNDEKGATTAYSDCVTSGTGKLGDVCTEPVDCGAGLTCWYGVCKSLCRTGGSDCASSSVCVPIDPGVRVAGTEWGVCQTKCDPATSAPCGSNQACIMTGDIQSNQITDCIKSGKGAELTACSSSYDCAPGLTCHGTELCVRYCDLSSPACSGSSTCVAFSDHPTYQGTEYGVCYPPCSLTDPSKVCPGGYTCSYTKTGSVTELYCSKAAASNPSSCKLNADCMPGYYCSTTGSCYKYCQVGSTGQCASGTTCKSWTTKFYVGGVEIGGCW
jgi:hypothetical protein